MRAEYPSDVVARFEREAPPVWDGDLATIAAPLDFLGVKNYSRTIVRAGPTPEGLQVRAAASPLTEMGWEVYPDGLREVLWRLHDEYDAPPMYVTRTAPHTQKSSS